MDILVLSKKFLKLAEEIIDYNLIRLSQVMSILLGKNIKEWISINNLSFKDYFYINNDKYIYYYPPGYSVFSGTNRPMVVVTNKYENLPNNLDATFEKLLLPCGLIPKLFLVAGNTFKVSKDPKIFSENNFIIKSIRALTKFSDEEILKLLTDNKEKIDSIRRLIQMQPEYLGGGVDGEAYKINNSMVLKIFVNNFAYIKAKESQDLLFKNPNLAGTEAMIYDVGEFKNDIYPIYYYIIELFKIPKDRDNLDYVIRNIESTISFIEWRSKFEIKKIRLEYYNKEITESDFKNKLKLFTELVYRQLMQSNPFISRMKIMQKEEGLSKDWLKRIIKEVIFKKITERNDLHSGNLGVNQRGHLRYFDPAFKTLNVL